jgi:hypothetical protein
MSIRQLLTITESHGFRALMTVAVWILGLLSKLERGLRNLTGGNRQFARKDVEAGSWLRTLVDGVAQARRKPVLWFDTFEGRVVPIMWSQHRRHVLLAVRVVHFPDLAFAEQACGTRYGQRRR